MVPAGHTPGARRALTEQEILDAALVLLDAGGAEAASIRRIAAAVGVPPNTVYTFFPDQAAIGRALVERLLGEVDHATAVAATAEAGPGAAEAAGRCGWRVGVELLALDLRRRLVSHPGAVPLMLGGPMDGPNALLLGELLLNLCGAGGLAPAVAARGAYLVMVYVLGAIALEVAGTPHAAALAPEAERIAARRATFAGLPAGSFPRTAAARDVMATWVGTEQYLWGLRRVLDGLERGGRTD
jgi:TetR/AcrR family transcriptional regulator, tetracycline repressor protein